MRVKSLFPLSWGLPRAITERIGSKIGRQRALFDDGNLLLLLQDIPKPFQDERVPKVFWREPSGAWHTSDQKRKGEAALTDLLRRIEKQLDILEDRAEAARTADDWFSVLKESAPLTRYARRLAHTLEDARTHVGADLFLINIRDLANNIERRFELLQEESRFGLDYVIARKGEERNELAHRLAEQSHRLNTIIALFLPITAITGIFGMNLMSGIEHWQTPIPFLISIIVSFIVGMWIRTNLDRRRRR